MEYISTRNSSIKVSSAQAIKQGISQEGGLFLPENLPQYDNETLKKLAGMNYNQRAEKILGDFLVDFSAEEIKLAVDKAYNKNSFASIEVTPISKLNDSLYSLELWHGPTCAFKDMALQILPHLLTTSIKKTGETKEVVILVATSGDTGKAALEGFKDIGGTRIIVFYPDGGVSPVQFLQMATQEGNNVGVFAVKGNFDDTQTTVKEIFTNPRVQQELNEKNMMFSSANSINWGRLLPQIVYYISSYLDLCNNNEITWGDSINVVVPTGNFGNILAAYYAKQMGVPIKKLICASNANNVLTDFINTGVYDRRRDFILTSSPSMDILISSNLERLLYELCRDDKEISKLMESLKSEGVYNVSDEVLSKIKTEFYGGFCTEEETSELIRRYFEKYNYLCDTHTAVAFGVYENYLKETEDKTKTIVISTASPYKFSGSMLKALEPELPYNDSFEGVFRLNEITGVEIPRQILDLQNKSKRFTKVCEKNEMLEMIKETLKI